MLKITDLHKTFDTREVLHGISLDVEDGEIFGFIGHNGAGKTTTLKCIAGILPYEKGEILIDHVSLAADPIRCKQMMAYLPDNPDLYETMTGIQFLNFIADIYGIGPDERTPRIESLAKELEIYEDLGDPIKSLSHGMKQKVAVISALIHEPRLLLLDEPFVGLDPKASHTLKMKMKELCEQGGSIFFSSHVLEVVQNLCDHIAIIKEGSLIRTGRTDEILSGGQNLEDLFLELEK